jgi:hypothetical protein
VSAEGGVSAGDEVGVLLADGDTDGITVRAGEVFFFFRCFGVGVGKDFSATRSRRGRTKSFLNLSPNVSSCSSVPRTTPALIAIVTAIANTRRSFLFTRQ